MSFRLVTLLCLTGMAACSHNTPSETAVNDPSYVNEPVQAKADPTLTPANGEGTARPVTPSTAEGPETVRAPLVADTKGTSSTDFKSKPDTQAGTSTTQPGTSTASPVAPDNTKVNKRDANSAALTPMDQSNDATSLKVTQQIRQALMSDNSLSFTAKNVKIITQNGKVTLRGPVNTTQERDSIDAAARKIAGSMPVDNQIEVKK